MNLMFPVALLRLLSFLLLFGAEFAESAESDVRLIGCHFVLLMTSFSLVENSLRFPSPPTPEGVIDSCTHRVNGGGKGCVKRFQHLFIIKTSALIRLWVSRGSWKKGNVRRTGSRRVVIRFRCLMDFDVLLALFGAFMCRPISIRRVLWDTR